MRLNARVEALEAASPINHNWHRVNVEVGQSPEDAIALYELEHWAVGSDNLIIRAFMLPLH
jgi:hypothetical protein